MKGERMEKDSMSLHQRTFLAKHGYIVRNSIGKGAFGRVYRVWDDRQGRFWACKVASDAVGRGILRREAMLQRSISHPIYAGFVDCLEEKEYTFLLMEYLDGESLDRCLERGRLDSAQAIRIAIQLAEGINYLHQLPEPVLYRDLKPQNICLAGDGRVRLMDLGCACTVSEARLSKAGSPGYAPWEQLQEREEGINARAVCPGFYSDVYALGRLLHQMLTGEDPCRPPRQKMPIRVYDRKLSLLLEKVVVQCVEEQPELRPPDMCCVMRMLCPLVTEGLRNKITLKRKELTARMGSLFVGEREHGFVYERNVCCPVLQEKT